MARTVTPRSCAENANFLGVTPPSSGGVGLCGVLACLARQSLRLCLSAAGRLRAPSIPNAFSQILIKSGTSNLPYFVFGFTVLFLLVLTSCGEFRPAWEVQKGNFNYERGQYQNAILSYHAARNSQETDKDIVHYNLGNVFYALGEGKAALQTWKIAEKNAADADILFRTAFNRGVVYLNLGQYDKAFFSFKRALEITPGDTNAKINLENALLHIGTNETRTGKTPEVNTSKSQSLLLDYMKRKEMDEQTGLPENEFIEDVEDW